VFGSSPDEPLSVTPSLDHARRNAAIFARNGGRPITIISFGRITAVETVEP
jgi:hypothetical protein